MAPGTSLPTPGRSERCPPLRQGSLHRPLRRKGPVALHRWLGTPDGVFGDGTEQAVSRVLCSPGLGSPLAGTPGIGRSRRAMP